MWNVLQCSWVGTSEYFIFFFTKAGLSWLGSHLARPVSLLIWDKERPMTVLWSVTHSLANTLTWYLGLVNMEDTKPEYLLANITFGCKAPEIISI